MKRTVYIKTQFWVPISKSRFGRFYVPSVCDDEEIIAITLDTRRTNRYSNDVEFDWSNINKGIVCYFCKDAGIYEDHISMYAIIKAEMDEDDYSYYYYQDRNLITPQIGIIKQSHCWPILWNKPGELNPEVYGFYNSYYSSGVMCGEETLRKAWDRNYDNERERTTIYIPEIISETEIKEDFMPFEKYIMAGNS